MTSFIRALCPFCKVYCWMKSAGWGQFQCRSCDRVCQAPPMAPGGYSAAYDINRRRRG